VPAKVPPSAVVPVTGIWASGAGTAAVSAAEAGAVVSATIVTSAIAAASRGRRTLFTYFPFVEIGAQCARNRLLTRQKIGYTGISFVLT
jgi:hypothetical protein